MISYMFDLFNPQCPKPFDLFLTNFDVFGVRGPLGVLGVLLLIKGFKTIFFQIPDPGLWRKQVHTPGTAGTWKNSGGHFLEFSSTVRLGRPKPYPLRHLRLPEHFQNYLPPSTAGDASFFRNGSGEGLSELVMEFPAVLRVFPKEASPMGRRECL